MSNCFLNYEYSIYEYNILNIFVLFIDLEKAFYNVRWEKLYHIMDTINIDFEDERLIHKLCINKIIVIKGEYDAYEETKIQ